MLEKLNLEQYKGVSVPCREVLELVKCKKNEGKSVSVAEVGIGVGATASAIVKLLDEADSYYMFSFEADVKDLEEDFHKADYCKAKVYAMGNTNKTYDSYVWTLAKLYLGERPSFDVVYLDGAHDFFHDGAACIILKKLTNVGGVLIFDDIDWRLGDSPTMNPEVNPKTAERYTQEQIDTYQIQMVVDVFMKDDPDWEEVKDFSSSHRVTYRKIR